LRSFGTQALRSIAVLERLIVAPLASRFTQVGKPACRTCKMPMCRPQRFSARVLPRD
jgi:hypothetical protein